MSGERGHKVYRFGGCELDLDLKEIRADGEVVSVEPRAFDLIAYMVANRDRLIDKDELNAEVWDGRIVSESALSTCLRQARRAIGDDGQRQDFIKTVPRRGFRFIGEVEEVEAIEVTPAAEVAAIQNLVLEASARQWRLGRPWILGALLLVMVALGAALWLAVTWERDVPSIAVLPFVAFDGDAEHVLFADGMAEDIITDLSRLEGLLVISRNSSFSFRDRQEQDIRGISDALGVRYLMEGSVRRHGDLVRVNAQLIDGHDGTHLWAERFEAPEADVLRLHDSIVERVVEALRITLNDRQRQSLKRVATRDIEAYRLYLEARALDRTGKHKETAKALKLYTQVLDRDPSFADAWAADALLAYYTWSLGRFWILEANEAQARIERSAKRALALDPENSTAHVALAKLHMHRRDYAKAIELGERAVSLPGGSFNLMALAYMYAVAGEPNAARVTLDRMARVEPSPDGRTLMGVGWTQLWMGDYAGVVEFQLQQVRGPVPLRAQARHLPGLCRRAAQGRDGEIARGLRGRSGPSADGPRNSPPPPVRRPHQGAMVHAGRG